MTVVGVLVRVIWGKNVAFCTGVSVPRRLKIDMLRLAMPWTEVVLETGVVEEYVSAMVGGMVGKWVSGPHGQLEGCVFFRCLSVSCSTNQRCTASG